MIPGFEQAMRTGNPDEDEALFTNVRAVMNTDAGRMLLKRMVAARHPMGNPLGATPEDTARINGERAVVAFFVRHSRIFDSL